MPKLLCLFILLATAESSAQPLFSFKAFQLPVSVSIRALEVVNDSTIWFGANRGIYGHTQNKGKTWIIDSISFNGFKPDFRSIAVLKNGTVLLLNAGAPVYLIKSNDKGLNWKTVFQSNDSTYFFDALRFHDNVSGAALGDPVNGCFKVIITNDGGETWVELPCNQTLKAMEGEACFAASNSSWDFYKKHNWIATGGKQSRILHSSDYGETFSHVQSPIAGGSELRGAFSLDFLDDKTGVLAGGNYDTTKIGDITYALTKDGGKTWTTTSTKNFFGSCVQIAVVNKEKVICAAGHDGVYFSNSMGAEWTEIKSSSNETLRQFNTLRFSSTGKAVWLAGAKGTIGKIEF